MTSFECTPGTRVRIQLYDAETKTSSYGTGVIKAYTLASIPFQFRGRIPVLWDDGHETYEDVLFLTKEGAETS